jgi:hypothetical protein
MRLSRKSKTKSKSKSRKSPLSVQKKMPRFAVGSTVKWTRYNGDTETTSYGKVINVHTSRITYVINGKERTYNGTENKPVYEIMTEDGFPVMLNAPRVSKSTKKL